MNQFVAIIALCLIVLIGASELQAAAGGTSAPAFELVTFSGETYNNVTQKGRPVIADFLGTLVQRLPA